MNVATAAWISEQKNTLSMLFYAVAILLYLRFDEEGRWCWYGLSLTAFLLALLSKTAVVMLPLVLLGCVWWTHRQLKWKDFLRSIPFFVLSLIMGLVTIRFQHAQSTYGSVVRNAGLAYRVAASAWIPWFYIYKDIFPTGLCVAYSKWHINPFSFSAYAPGLLLVGGMIVFWRKRATWGRPWFFALGGFVVSLLPVLGLVGMTFYTDSPVADHWQYFALPWVLGLLAAGVVTVWDHADKARRSAKMLINVVVLAVLGIATWARCCVYASDETLWRDTLAKNPDAWLAHNNLGAVLMREGNISEAVAHYKQAVRIDPDLAGVHYNLGDALVKEGRVQEAIGHYEQALRIKPDFAEAHYDLGTTLMGQGKLQEAILHYDQALRIKPDFAEAHCNLGFILQQIGRTQEAIAEYKQALRIKPDFIEAHFNLGLALEKLGRTPEAIQQYEQTLQLRPDYAPANDALTRLRTSQ